MEFKIFDLGSIDFQKAWDFQKEIFQKVKNNYFKAALILCRHYPVITVGRLGKKENIKTSLNELKNRSIHIYEIERGGDITYHGPGQLIAYPIFNLNYLRKDIHLFLRKLEEVVIDFLSDFGIEGLRYPGLTGVWIDKSRPFSTNAYDSNRKGRDKSRSSLKSLIALEEGRDKQKIASIGIAIKNWITFHGVSVNIKKEDLVNFQLIKPCGTDIEMTSLESVLRRDVEIDDIKDRFIHNFKNNYKVAYS
jgi:lipoate-protein ligase B